MVNVLWGWPVFTYPSCFWLFVVNFAEATWNLRTLRVQFESHSVKKVMQAIQWHMMIFAENI